MTKSLKMTNTESTIFNYKKGIKAFDDFYTSHHQKIPIFKKNLKIVRVSSIIFLFLFVSFGVLLYHSMENNVSPTYGSFSIISLGLLVGSIVSIVILFPTKENISPTLHNISFYIKNTLTQSTSFQEDLPFDKLSTLPKYTKGMSNPSLLFPYNNTIVKLWELHLIKEFKSHTTKKNGGIEVQDKKRSSFLGHVFEFPVSNPHFFSLLHNSTQTNIHSESSFQEAKKHCIDFKKTFHSKLYLELQQNTLYVCVHWKLKELNFENRNDFNTQFKGFNEQLQKVCEVVELIEKDLKNFS